MRTYTTSFFIVSRFLPRPKREMVEAVYAAVRWPDEVVDSFPLSPAERLERLDVWARAYERAVADSKGRNVMVDLEDGVPVFLAPFCEVARRAGVPVEHYRSFLDAMRLDASPRPYRDLDDLIDSYVYGSAIVVGYFLTYIYGSSTPDFFPRALESARDLGIGLQLTNFLRDVREDWRRGRVYLPQDMLAKEGLAGVNLESRDARPGLCRIVRELGETTAGYYERSRRNLDAFSPDCRVAIQACIDVYGKLNDRIRQEADPVESRQSVPFREKWAVLPPSKYWKAPLGWFGL
jgi:phytoene synthase